MAAMDVHYNDTYYNSTLGAKTFNPPAGCITDNAIAALANLAASKLEHQHALNYQQAPGTAVVAATQLLHIVRAAGTLAGIQVITPLPATGADRTVNVDLQRSAGGGAFATVLSATVLLNNLTTALAAVNGTFSATTLSVGDILRVVVTVAGAAGNQAQGLLVTTTIRETAQ